MKTKPAIILNSSVIQDTDEYKDFDIYINNRSDRDWLIRFWLDKATAKWVEGPYLVAAPDHVSSFDSEVKPEDVPADIRAAVQKHMAAVAASEAIRPFQLGEYVNQDGALGDCGFAPEGDERLALA